eukprot:TRINITY_DN298_c0_g1_i2.p4 TRINITY_DN298_c0_g1~~TRINITY_DN298_c0_g1_i2.p4  ORF type:complete len:159 (+),score=82.44 TRINITY_DN298_c0_g1_i2:2161-2637(+)
MFMSKIFHPNVYNDGSICLDILQNQWSPIYDIAAILTSIQSLLCDPNPNSPANSEAARLFKENKREYNRKVKEYVEKSWEGSIFDDDDDEYDDDSDDDSDDSDDDDDEEGNEEELQIESEVDKTMEQESINNESNSSAGNGGDDAMDTTTQSSSTATE